VSVALRSSPIEDSITYKTVIKSRRPKDTRMPLPASYWNRNGGCRDMTATGVCGGQVVTGFDKPLRCYFHQKVHEGKIVILPGSMFITNGTTDRMPPQRGRPRKEA
jgi:hypothetical protein